MKRKPTAVSHGAWWRFSEYEIADGWIRPTARAKLERYDPWQQFRGSRKLTMGEAKRRVLAHGNCLATAVVARWKVLAWRGSMTNGYRLFVTVFALAQVGN